MLHICKVFFPNQHGAIYLFVYNFLLTIAITISLCLLYDAQPYAHESIQHLLELHLFSCLAYQKSCRRQQSVVVLSCMRRLALIVIQVQQVVNYLWELFSPRSVDRFDGLYRNPSFLSSASYW